MLLKIDDNEDFEQEEDYNRRTPKMLENEECTENRPLAVPK